MHTITKKNCCKLNKEACFIGCKYYKTGECEGSRGIIALPNGQNVNMPLYHEYKDNYYKDIIMKIEKTGYMTMQEVMQTLKQKYNLEFTKANLHRYANLGLIKPGIQEAFPGISGSVSFYPNETPEMIYIVKFLNKERLSLEEISEHYQGFLQGFVYSAIGPYGIIYDLETAQFYTALACFLAIGKIDFAKHSLEGMKIEFINDTPNQEYYLTYPEIIRVKYVENGKVLTELIYNTNQIKSNINN